MQIEVETPHSLLKLCKKILSVSTVLEPDHKVVRVAHYYYVTAPLLSPPLVGPQIEYVMKIDVRK
jgi:hypothetical protein